MTELTNWLLTQGPFAGACAILLLHIVRMEQRHAAEVTDLKKDLKDERDRNSELQDSRLEESKVLVEVVQSNRTTLQSVLAAIQGRVTDA